MRMMVLGVVAASVLAGCEGRELPPPPGPPVPPTPDLPMTAAKSREIMGTLSNTCRELATMKFDMHECERKQGRTVDDAALRTELRDLRWNLQKITPDESSAQCAAMTAELGKTPKPQACW